ncbi:MAG: sigma-70 family RNA polymerase sigma factor [Acidobacteria bacterium]|nr:sigma-70 family RNA polymerase sigma factor [Acidobacteriota bacterium]
MMETEKAVRRYLEGDEEAFNRIVSRWERKVYSLAWRMVGNHEDAQDIVQDTFLSVFRSLKGLRDPGTFPTWLYQITLNHCRSRWKARNPDVSLSDGEAVLQGVSGAATDGRSDSVETMDIIRKALANLSEDHRTAIVLKEYLGLSLEEIADVMECPLSTAKSRLYHGLMTVQRNLKRLGLKAEG